MTAGDLAPVPIDDEALDLYELALAPGGPKLTGVLDLLSGGDAGQEAIGMAGSTPLTGGRSLYSKNDLLRALIAEVRQLRALTTERT